MSGTIDINITKILEAEMKDENKRFKKSYEGLEGLKYFISLNMGGKRIRGTLLLLCYLLAEMHKEERDMDDLGEEELKEKLEEQMPLATGIEFCQTAILIQDDVIDGSNTRRDGKAVHVSLYEDADSSFYHQKKESEEAAVLLGSIAFCYAYELIRKACYKKQNGDVMDQLKKMVYKTLGGEMLDVTVPLRYKENARKGRTYSDAIVIAEDIAGLKTAEYTFVFPMMVGFMLAGIKEEQNVLEAGKKLGVAYQLKNDFESFKYMLEQGEIPSDIVRFRLTYINALLMQDPKMAEYILNYDGTEQKRKEILEYVRAHEKEIKGKVNEEQEKLQEEAFEMLRNLVFLDEKNLAILLEYIEKILSIVAVTPTPNPAHTLDVAWQI